MNLAGQSVGNNGPLYIGRDPWYAGIINAGYDNVQVHNRALTNEELNQATAGSFIIDDNCVLALDFTGGATNDLSA